MTTQTLLTLNYKYCSISMQLPYIIVLFIMKLYKSNDKMHHYAETFALLPLLYELTSLD